MGGVSTRSPAVGDGKVIRRLLAALVLLAGGLYVAGYLLVSDRVPQGTAVSGVRVGGLSEAAARAKLGRELGAVAARPISVRAPGLRARLRPAQAGLQVDVPASVAQVRSGHSWDPRRMWDYVVGGRDLPAVVRVDSDKLERAVAGLAARVDRPARDGRVLFRDGEARPRPSADGLALDRGAAARALRRAFLAERGPVDLRTRAVAPAIDKGAVSRAMESVANPAVSAPVVVRLRGQDAVLKPSVYAPVLSMVPRGGRLQLRVDQKQLAAVVREALRTTSVVPHDATVALVHGRPRVIPARRGVTFDGHRLAGDFSAAVVAADEDRLVRLKAVVAKPAFSTAEARRLGVREKVSEFTTYFPHADYRNTNLGRAAELVNGTLLKPGDTFSLNRVVGERTPENGFTKGFIISDGVYKEDYGGGVSQVATTTFNAAFFAGLEDVEHKPHSFYIDRYPVGREATVAWPTIDLRFRNTTPYGVLVQAWIDPSSPSSQGAMHVRMWSTKYWRIEAGRSPRYRPTSPAVRRLSGPDCVPHEGYGGFDIDVYRSFYRVGSQKLDRKETMHTRYTPSDTVVCS